MKRVNLFEVFFVQSLLISAYKFVVAFEVQYLLYSTVFLYFLGQQKTGNRKNEER